MATLTTRAGMRRAILVSPYFLPSNVAGVHRVRIMAAGLKSFGWHPTVLTVNPAYFEERFDPALAHLVPDGLEIETVAALPAKICRSFGVGDLSLRAQLTLRARLSRLIKDAKADLVFATVLPGYTALVGAWAKRRFKIPFVLDYQDPWMPRLSPRLGWNKQGITTRLTRVLEPGAVRAADALTAVSDETLTALRARDLIGPHVPIEIIPIGADRNDHSVALQYGKSFINRKQSRLHLAYLGTLTDRMLPALEALLRAVRKVEQKSPGRISVHLIGTSAQPDGKDTHGLAALAEQIGLGDAVQLHPGRISYLDALRSMHDADMLLLLGSTDSHYTASKLFPCWLSGKPVFGLFHRESTIVELARELGGVRLVTYDAQSDRARLADDAARLLEDAAQGRNIVSARNEQAFDGYSEHGIASRYAQIFDKVAAKCA